MLICKSCGAELKPGAKFCLECGSAAPEVTETSSAPAAEIPVVSAEPEIKAEANAETAESVLPEIKKLPPKPPKPVPVPVSAPAPKIESVEEIKKEKLIDETIEKVEEIASEALPEVKQINIIKPKDISVLKPKRSEPIQKKTSSSAVSKPLPTAAELKRIEDEKDLPPMPSRTYKKEVEEVELPSEPKMEYYANEGSQNVIASNFINGRTDDFSKGFYSDVEKNEAERKAAAALPAAPKKAPKKKSSSVGRTIFVILLIIAVIGGFVYYFLFMMPAQNGAGIFLFSAGQLEKPDRTLPDRETDIASCAPSERKELIPAKVISIT